jgi:hypothetical protein
MKSGRYPEIDPAEETDKIRRMEDDKLQGSV